MGVKGLWTLVGPAARPTQLESLRKKRIAIDASIWIHQFIRTMRDKEGNALKNGHLLGFFRRICKLLFFDIKPVFVFDGGAPTLKRNTIRERRKRREGVKASLKATARKILSAQVKSRILLQEEQQISKGNATENEDFVYYDQLEATTAAVNVLKKTRKLDQYELPEMTERNQGDKLDPRLATKEEIKNFIDEFQPSDLDIDSEAFHSLPVEVQYEVIQDLMWKSRSTSWARLDDMIRQSKTALDFSKQQIKLLKYRNEMTQRLVNVNTNSSAGITNESARIAGERGRQYVLYKNENINEGLGWKLPGTSVSEPVYIDTAPTRSEPKLEIPTESHFSSQEIKPKDKVAEAMANNPKLAALFDNFLSEEEEEEEFENIDVIDKDNEPLFMTQEKGLVNDMNAYADDDTIDQVISRIYNNEPEQFEEVDHDNSSLSDLNADDFYELWISKVPDAFIYLHSFNDEYKQIMKKSIEEYDLERVSNFLATTKKQYSKTNENDELALEALQFQISFLENVQKWKLKHPIQSEKVEMDDTEFIIESEIPTDENIVILDDNENDDDIQWINSSLQKTNDTEIMNEPISSNTEHVHINIQQSSLRSSKKEDSVNTNNDTIDHVNKDLDSMSETVEQEQLSDEQELSEEHQSIENTDTDMNKEVQVTEKEYGYNSEDELDNHVQGEDEEFSRFMSDIASKHLDEIRTELYQDIKDLNQQHRKELGNAEDITDQMIQDIQELLKLFGIPYIVSPMEAEAQCAELESLALVDGTITDDSDVFLFGANRVYKNMFNQQRYVECYNYQDIEREMLLSRKKLIQLAFLLGSDYTEGVPGVGPVAAMEILSEFSSNEDDEAIEVPLKRFKDWYNGGKDETLFQKKFRKKHDALDIPDDFPNALVIDAYYHPTVDNSSQKFEWGQPQLDTLRTFLMEAFGWPEDKADQVLLPVLREMNKKLASGEQTTIGSYFNATSNVSSSSKRPQTKHSSKRVQNIVDNWRKQKKSKTNQVLE